MTPVDLPAPPARPDGSALWATAAIPVVGSLGTLALVLSGGRRHLLIGLALAAATLGAMLLQTLAQHAARRHQVRLIRERYRQDLQHARDALLADDPTDPSTLICIGRDLRAIEFIAAADGPRADPVCVRARDQFQETYAQVRDAPYEIDLAATTHLAADRAHARAIVLAAAERCSPSALGIEVRTRDQDAWSWIALLPHARGLGQHRIVVSDRPEPTAPDSTVILLTDQPRPYTPDRCGPAEAAARARLLGAATEPTEDDRRPWSAALGAGTEDTVTLDIREAAEGGVGPHGLLVGATGSGKSELLRQIVGDLVAQHPSDDLRLALVDYKGGAAFAAFEHLPHTAAYVTNLADTGIARRLHEALEGELTRRQEALADAGAGSVREHPMPRLLIVVDEFTELLAAEPEAAGLFARIGRLGRSLGIHLLLSTQRLEEGRLHGLEAHLSYRIALRTFTAAESRLAIGSAQAAELPHRPGAGILAAGGSISTFAAPDPRRRIQPRPRVDLVTLAQAEPAGPTVLETRVRQARGQPAPPLWLPPLTGSTPVDALPVGGHLHAVIGLIDRPREQRIDPLDLDLTGSNGHIAIVGGPRSGKSTALRTLAASLRRSTPDIRLLGLDLTGGLAGAVPRERLATARTPERIDRLLRHLRRLTETGASPPIVVLIDGWGAMRDHYAWVDQWHRIGERGLSADIHLAVATHRWTDLRPAMRDLFGSRIELRLGDPLDSDIDRRLAAGVPALPGHGLVAPGFAIQVAVDSLT